MKQIAWLLVPVWLAAPALAADALVVQVSGIRETDGEIRAALWSAPAGFPEAHERAAQRVSVPASAERVSLVFPDVAPGRYAVSVVHDRDGDGELDRNFLGIPREAVGISNGAVGLTGPGSFADALVSVDAPPTPIEIELYHW